MILRLLDTMYFELIQACTVLYKKARLEFRIRNVMLGKIGNPKRESIDSILDKR